MRTLKIVDISVELPDFSLVKIGFLHKSVVILGYDVVVLKSRAQIRYELFEMAIRLIGLDIS